MTAMHPPGPAQSPGRLSAMASQVRAAQDSGDRGWLYDLVAATLLLDIEEHATVWRLAVLMEP